MQEDQDNRNAILPSSESIKLTQFSRGAGCGCKISPAVLEQILASDSQIPSHKNLLVGNGSNDDAAVYDNGNGTATILTTDFFMPVVDDAYSFGMIASANAISDVYAMGGTPVCAVAILGWPIEKLPASLARRVLQGARKVCADAGIPLAGGHSIDSLEPMFGLAVTGTVRINHLKKNNTANEGDLIFITKPIGVGILSTAEKRGLLDKKQKDLLIAHLSALNKIGEKLGTVADVSAMTDITGFGLLGHLIEMAEGAGLSAEINYSQIPVIEEVKDMLAKRVIPDATYRNWNSYSNKTEFEKGVNVMEAFNLLPDPQTNGGLLFTIGSSFAQNLHKLLGVQENEIFCIGKMVSKQTKTILVKN